MNADEMRDMLDMLDRTLAATTKARDYHNEQIGRLTEIRYDVANALWDQQSRERSQVAS